MEKLQAAIEKARVQRDKQTASAPRPQPPEPKQPETPENPPESGRWKAIPELALTPRVARRNRLFVDGSSQEAVYFDKLRTKILQQCWEHGWKRLVITSATKSCGKTTIAVNLAASFTRQKDRHLVLLDLDMRRPEIARTLQHRPKCSFSDVLEDRDTFESCAARLGQNVLVGMNRERHANPSELLLQDRTAQILDEIEARYQPDLMVFDTPPLLVTDDTLAFLRNTDCVIIVAAAESTTTDEIDVVEKEVAQQTNVMGVVLNKCTYMDRSQDYYYR